MIEGELPVAAQRAAQHCAQLLSRAADPVDPAQEVAGLARRFAQEAMLGLAELCDARGLRVDVEEPRLLDCETLWAALGVHSVNSFLSLGTERMGALISVPICEVNAQFERLLGGDGRVDRTSVRLPQSALPFVSRFEQHILTALRNASRREEFALSASLGKAAEIAPFAPAEAVWILDFLVTPPAGSQWKMTMALCRASLRQIVDARAASPATGRAIGERGIDRSAIGEMELPLCAILVDSAVPLSRLTQLQVGAIIPIAVNRSIPLLIEHAVIAHGTAGEVDDSIALEITHTTLPGLH